MVSEKSAYEKRAANEESSVSAGATRAERS
jgi:hypothetical protein